MKKIGKERGYKELDKQNRKKHPSNSPAFAGRQASKREHYTPTGSISAFDSTHRSARTDLKKIQFEVE